MNEPEDLERLVMQDMSLAVASMSDWHIETPEAFINIVRGRTNVRNTGFHRECRIELPVRSTGDAPKLAAIFGCRGSGVFDSLEVAMLKTPRKTVVWKRRGRQASLAIDGHEMGGIDLGWWLRHAYIGRGAVWFGAERLCTFALPFFGPSAPQTADCTGQFKLATTGRTIRFVISPKDVEGSTMQSAFAWGWSRLRGKRMPIPVAAGTCDRSIFYASDLDVLARLSSEQRLVLLAIAVWPWALYKGLGT